MLKNQCWCLCIISVLIIFFIETLSAQNRNLCDICECIPSYAEPSYVNCNCKKNKVLLLKEEDGDVLANTRVLNISTCNFVSFPANGFAKTKKLRSVQIKQMKLFHLNSGIFPFAVNLAIEDVNELIIDGFQGQTNLANIEIRNSVLSELAENSFRDLKNLEKLNFYDVSINSVDSNSLTILSNVTKPWIKFINCRIDTIQSDGISLQVSKMEIINTSINIMNSNALYIIANDSIDIIRSTFGALISPDSFRFKSNKINIVDNEFKSLPSNLLRDIELANDKKINFIGNLIHDIDLGGFLLNSRFDKLNFVKNKIMCDCTPRKTSILKLKEVFPGLLTNDTNFDSIIENNSCKNYNGIYLSEFKRKFLARTFCNDTDSKLFPFSYSTEQSDGLAGITQSSTQAAEIRSTGSSHLFKLSLPSVFACVCANAFINT